MNTLPSHLSASWPHPGLRCLMKESIPSAGAGGKTALDGVWCHCLQTRPGSAQRAWDDGQPGKHWVCDGNGDGTAIRAVPGIATAPTPDLPNSPSPQVFAGGTLKAVAAWNELRCFEQRLIWGSREKTLRSKNHKHSNKDGETPETTPDGTGGEVGGPTCDVPEKRK